MSLSNNFPAIRPSLLLDFANTTVLDPRITFTRASTATYYDGVTVAKAEENLFAYSQEFDNAYWTVGNFTTSANTTTAPDGTTTADSIIESSATSNRYIRRAVSVTSGLPYVFSIFVKKGDGASARDFVQISLQTSGFGSASYANFDIVNGTVTTTGAGLTSATITSAGNNWWRCSVFDTATASVSGFFNIVGITTGTAVQEESYAGSTSANIFLWGAQLEQRSSVTAYTATTTQPITNYIPVLLTAPVNTARFEHNPTTGESLGLEIEEQRTNLFQRGEEFDNAYWTKSNSTVTANTIVAPDGTLTGDKLVETATTNNHQFFRAETTLAQAYTYSLYIKQAGRFASLGMSGTATRYAWFDLSNGTISNTSNCTALISSVGNGWYRCSITATLAAESTFFQFFLGQTASGYAPSYAGDGFSGAYIWGAQLEAGSFSTSYIPTVASQVTRSADAASMTGTNFSSWYNAGEGTLYSESIFNGDSAFLQRIGISVSDGTTSNRITSVINSGTVIRNIISVSGTAQADMNSTVTSTFNTFNKNILAYKANDFATTANGVAVQTDASGSVPVVNQAWFGQTEAGGSALMLNGSIKKIAYYPIRVTNAQLQALTSN